MAATPSPVNPLRVGLGRAIWSRWRAKTRSGKSDWRPRYARIFGVGKSSPATSIKRTSRNVRNETVRLSVAVAERLLAKRAFDTAGNRVAEPDHGSEQQDGKGEQQSVSHESSP